MITALPAENTTIITTTTTAIAVTTETAHHRGDVGKQPAWHIETIIPAVVRPTEVANALAAVRPSKQR